MGFLEITDLGKTAPCPEDLPRPCDSWMHTRCFTSIGTFFCKWRHFCKQFYSYFSPTFCGFYVLCLLEIILCQCIVIFFVIIFVSSQQILFLQKKGSATQDCYGKLRVKNKKGNLPKTWRSRFDEDFSEWRKPDVCLITCISIEQNTNSMTQNVTKA